jgi:HEAT repeat protein
VTQDPTCLRRPGLKKSLASFTPAQIRGAFRDFFRLAAQERSTALLVELPTDLVAVEEILFSAMEHGSPLTRRLAILQLGRYRSPQATKTLIEIVRLNNFREQPALAEVEAALASLLRQNTNSARAFLEDVPRRRRHLFFHVYQRSIRKTLSSLLSGKKVS